MAIGRDHAKSVGRRGRDNIHLRQATVSRLEAGAPAIQLRTLMSALAALDLELVVRPRSKGSAADIGDLF